MVIFVPTIALSSPLPQNKFQFIWDSSCLIAGEKDLTDRQGRPLLTADSAHGILPFQHTPGNTLIGIQQHPYFDMRCILAATDNFSDTLKLGQGGFGPVYKVAIV